jgi:hypothetical protein
MLKTKTVVWKKGQFSNPVWQTHACLSILTGGEPPSLDLLVFQRGVLRLILNADLNFGVVSCVGGRPPYRLLSPAAVIV